MCADGTSKGVHTRAFGLLESESVSCSNGTTTQVTSSTTAALSSLGTHNSAGKNTDLGRTASSVAVL
jgi:hypothetical protein